MKRSPHRSLVCLGFAVTLALLGGARSASADTASCSRSYEAAQRLRKEAKLLDARREILVCAQDECPAALRKDCGKWLGELTETIPALAVQVRGADACDRPQAPVSIDGVPLPSGMMGRPVDVDPGPHDLRAEVDGEVVKQSVIVSPGEHGRIVVLTTAVAGAACGLRPAPKPAPPSEGPPPREAPPPQPPERRTQPIVYVLGGIGLVSLGVGTGFGISGWSQKGTLDDCKGTCATHDVDTMRRTFLVADIGLGVGVAALVAAAIVQLTR